MYPSTPGASEDPIKHCQHKDMEWGFSRRAGGSDLKPKTRGKDSGGLHWSVKDTQVPREPALRFPHTKVF